MIEKKEKWLKDYSIMVKCIWAVLAKGCEEGYGFVRIIAVFAGAAVFVAETVFPGGGAALAEWAVCALLCDLVILPSSLRLTGNGGYATAIPCGNTNGSRSFAPGLAIDIQLCQKCWRV